MQNIHSALKSIELQSSKYAMRFCTSNAYRYDLTVPADQ